MGLCGGVFEPSPEGVQRDTGHQRESKSVARENGVGERGREIVAILSLWILTALFVVPALPALEFFRHTEADRTLIAWEMLERGDYVVPHLLGSELLTKPPLFYWAVAGAIALFHSAVEWVARVPSFIAGLVFVAAQFLFARSAGLSPRSAFLSAVVLLTGGGFLQLAAAAEIDMMFGLLCALGGGLSFLANTRRWIGFDLLLGLVAGLGLLTKGPVVLVFLYIPHIIFGFIERVSVQDRPDLRFLFSFGLRVGVSLLCAVLVFLPWFALLAERVGLERVREVQEVELLRRFFGPDRQEHGVLFYIPALFGLLAPWSIFPFLDVIQHHRGVSGWYARFREVLSSSKNLFMVHHLVIVVLGFLFLSTAEGKANRYAYPLYGSAAYLCSISVDRLFFRVGSNLVAGVLRSMGMFLFVVVGSVAVLAIWFGHVPFRLQAMLLAVGFGSLFLIETGRRRWRGALFGSLLVTIFSVRLGEVLVFAPYRNTTRGVSHIAREIDTELPVGVSLYTVEFFERWVNYYLKRLGRESFRLTPQLLASSIAPDENLFIILNAEHELWRVRELEGCDPSTRVVRSLAGPRIASVLVQTTGVGAKCLTLSEEMPTNYTFARGSGF